MKPQTVYVKVPEDNKDVVDYYVTRFSDEDTVIAWVKPLTALVFTVEEFEAEKLKIASEAWDAALVKFIEGGMKSTAPSKEAYLSTIKK